MPNSQMQRRTFLATTAGTLAGLPIGAYAQNGSSASPTTQRSGNQPMPGEFPIKAISSANGTRATSRAYEMIRAGSDPLDAVVAGVNIVEDDPDDMTVGYGGLPNENGVVELDAAVMHGPTHRAGSVASLQNIRNPAKVAQLVLEQTDHVLLVGLGALEFAKACGFKEENLLTEKARKIWLYWKQSLSDRDDWLPPAVDDLDPDVIRFFKLKPKATNGGASTNQPNGSRKTAKMDWSKFDRPTGTIHCAGMNANGDISCTTTTSGLAFKIPGRVGDSPIIGAGLYVDNEVGSCGSTGRGEANLQNLCCSSAVELMRSGMSPEEAGLEVLRRVAHNTTENHLLDDQGRPNFGLKFYLLAKDGTHAGVTMWGPSDFAVTDEKGTRKEQCAFLYNNADR